jgi:predicted carbohydrate-binding protein with CBM48
VSDQVPEFLQDYVVALREPTPIDPARRRRVVEAVRASARQKRARRSLSTSGLAIAAGIAALVSFATVSGPSMSASRASGAHLLGDTVAATLRDTMRLVQFMLVAPAASRVALAGDFNAWNLRATPLGRSGDGPWTVAVALPAGRHRYAFVVDDTQWVRDPLGVVDADRGKSVVLVK